jgi:hypothetical protein
MKIKIPMILIAGSVMGIGAAAAQAFFNVQPPVAYGICLLGHPSDVINWVANKLFRTSLSVHEVSIGFPVLTPIGVILGAVLAAIRHREFKFTPGPVRDPVVAFTLGFLVANFGLLWGACPIRTTVLAAYGFVPAFLVLAFIVLGVILACEYMKRQAKRAVES